MRRGRFGPRLLFVWKKIKTTWFMVQERTELANALRQAARIEMEATQEQAPRTTSLLLFLKAYHHYYYYYYYLQFMMFAVYDVTNENLIRELEMEAFLKAFPALPDSAGFGTSKQTTTAIISSRKRKAVRGFNDYYCGY